MLVFQIKRLKTPDINSNNINMPFKEQHYCAGIIAHSGKHKSDLFMSVVYRCFGLNPFGIYGEGDCNGLRLWSWNEKKHYISGHPAEDDYKLMVRDFLWSALINRIFLAWNWNELLRTDEHLMPAKISRLIDWDNFKSCVPPVMLRVRGIEDVDVDKLLDYEEKFSSIGLDCRYVWGNDPLPEGTDVWVQPDRKTPPYVVFETQDEVNKEFFENLPEQVEKIHYIRLKAEGYSATNLISKDLRQIVVFLRNTTNYLRGGKKGTLYKWCRRGNRKNSDFNLDIVNLPKRKRLLRLYDLDKKKLLKEEQITNEWHCSKKGTNHDFVIVIT